MSTGAISSLLILSTIVVCAIALLLQHLELSK
jgi:hypothetical protein